MGKPYQFALSKEVGAKYAARGAAANIRNWVYPFDGEQLTAVQIAERMGITHVAVKSRMQRLKEMGLGVSRENLEKAGRYAEYRRNQSQRQDQGTDQGSL